MTKVITEKHPFMQKVEQLYQKMEELGIRLDYGGAGGLTITDTEKNVKYRLKDKETSEYLPYFPTGFEYKLTFETS